MLEKLKKIFGDSWHLDFASTTELQSIYFNVPSWGTIKEGDKIMDYL